MVTHLRFVWARFMPETQNTLPVEMHYSQNCTDCSKKMSVLIRVHKQMINFSWIHVFLEDQAFFVAP